MAANTAAGVMWHQRSCINSWRGSGGSESGAAYQRNGGENEMAGGVMAGLGEAGVKSLQRNQAAQRG